ncbi:hypothetical protein [Delftia tsuruhatensis]|uniref:hypothetical protein n=1 Tax=Delftia tsuruhatensis TaxID=180282 RepID=UPI00289F5ECE|nr:hypothetical protein [Delftia tsuruhatensis]
MSLAIYARHYLSLSHLSAASLFSKECEDIEPIAKQTDLGSTERRKHKAYAISTVIECAAFLEATINELFSDCADENNKDRTESLTARQLMARLWKRKIPRSASYSILDKYDICLELNNKEPFATGARPYQDIKLLVDLRNALIHYEPEDILTNAESNSKRIHKFEKSFRGKFPENAIAGPGNAYYPDKLLGAGCAKWSVASSIAFTDEFFSKIETTATYEHVRSKYLF